MHIRVYVLFSLAMILAVSLIMGCITLPFFGQSPQETPKPASGFTSMNIPYESPSYNNFDDALLDIAGVELADNTSTNAIVSPEKEVLYISGRGLDSSGNASTWIFAVRHANSTFIVTYNRNGRSIVNWPAGFSGPVILTDQIIRPRELMDRNRALIFGNWSANETFSQDLVLEDGNYTFTQSRQGASRNLIFNAVTGVLISSHE
jgi:hypothetical protein